MVTSDGGAARQFQNEVEVGMVGIDVPIRVPTAYYSFGGRRRRRRCSRMMNSEAAPACTLAWSPTFTSARVPGFSVLPCHLRARFPGQPRFSSTGPRKSSLLYDSRTPLDGSCEPARQHAE
ncbi:MULTISPECIES: hypothetical protein [Rhodococcus]|uniref:Uncharacterized protein n=1 Tax=Rhodococcus opacus TaxID=37919 RepID=A0AAX3YCM6_RHOOP|nr:MULTISPECIES: hypothetical protein [Rhodococcus]MCZ4582965.1 hypothetical protein [Rhodococcus opacus]MDI9935535.1 hypothetical protein [Rhodococcus sp. IEGM 1351]QZS60008.1 hypothetical protein FXW36_13815 [Rhodococcus opacus]WKN54384.1 hypothetical protein HJ581_0011605 [Rhodococcus opacus]WLF45829.1 hypothetical protein Q5707_28650 [Rhodococcus opacus]